MLFTLIRNELRKTLRRGKTWVVFALFIIFVSLLGFGNYYAERQEKKYSSPEAQIEAIDNNIKYTQEDWDRTQQDLKEKDPAKFEEIKQSYTEEINNLKAQKEALQKLINSSANDEDLWKAQLDNQITSIETQLNDERTPERYKADLKSSLKELKYLKENNIKPMKDSDFISYNYIQILMTVLGTIFLGIGIAIFMSDIVSGESTPATLKFLLIQPVSRGKILLSKFISIFITTLTMIISIELIAFLLIGLFKGFGNPNYPKAFGTLYQYDLSKIENGAHPLIEVANSTTLITISQFTLRAFLLQSLYILACCAFIFMISSLVKSSMISMAISIAVITAANILNQALAAFRKVSYLFFSSYGDPTSLMSGRLTALFNKPFITIEFAIVVMVTWTLISYLIAHFVFTKKDILI